MQTYLHVGSVVVGAAVGPLVDGESAGDDVVGETLGTNVGDDIYEAFGLNMVAGTLIESNMVMVVFPWAACAK